MSTNHEHAAKWFERTGNEANDKETSRRAVEKESVKSFAWLKWLFIGALVVVLGVALTMGGGLFGTGSQNGNQLAGVAGQGAQDTLTPTLTSTEIPASTEIPTSTPTLAPTATFTPSLGIGSSWIRPSDGMTMMYVPQGPFTMGIRAEDAQAQCEQARAECKATWFADEEPPHQVELDAYWMDQTEVTNAMYALCVSAGVCSLPKQLGSYDVEDYFGNPQYADYPVVFIDWDRANAYCQWAGGRLPTEAEWEKAARSTDQRSYPWGNSEPSCGMLNFHPFNGSACKGDTSAVDEYPYGQSPYQIFNLAGNVFEWVMDWWAPNYYANSPLSNPQGPETGQFKILRGGSWFFDEAFARSTYRYKHAPIYHFSFTGFRCVMPE